MSTGYNWVLKDGGIYHLEETGILLHPVGGGYRAHDDDTGQDIGLYGSLDEAKAAVERRASTK